MRGPEEWPSHRSNPADRIRLTGPAATKFLVPPVFEDKLSKSSSGAPYMSAPSRRPEIRRRRTRKEKIVQLRKRLAAAKADADRERLTAKLHKMAIGSPGRPLLK